MPEDPRELTEKFDIDPKNFIKSIEFILDQVEIKNIGDLRTNDTDVIEFLNDSKAFDYCFINLRDYLNSKLSNVEADLLTRISQQYSNAICRLSTIHTQTVDGYKAHIQSFETRIEALTSQHRLEIAELKDVVINKEKEIENFKLRGKLTREQKEALKFVEDKYLQSDSMGDIIIKDHIKTFSSTDELEKLIATDLNKVTESGVTQVSIYQPSISLIHADPEPVLRNSQPVFRRGHFLKLHDHVEIKRTSGKFHTTSSKVKSAKS